MLQLKKDNLPQIIIALVIILFLAITIYSWRQASMTLPPQHILNRQNIIIPKEVLKREREILEQLKQIEAPESWQKHNIEQDLEN